jgi:hypothetical protein
VDRASAFEQSIGQGGLSVIDVRDNAEIARVLDTHEARQLCGRRQSSTSVALVFWRSTEIPVSGSRLPACAPRSLKLATGAVVPTIDLNAKVNR